MPTQALCATLLPIVGDLWFSTDPAEREEARRYCGRCPLLYGCAEAGLAETDTYGVWGALDSGDRAAYRCEPDGPNPDDYEVTGPMTPLRGCGTEAAYRAHRMRHEDCAPCTAEHKARVEADRRARLAAEHAKGGTDAGHRIHRALGETPCIPCHNAAIKRRADDKARRAAARAAEPSEETARAAA
jgi:hypothetical protein